MGYLLIAAFVQALVALYLLRKNFYNQKAEFFLWMYLALTAVHLSIKFFLYEVVNDDFLFTHFVTSFSLGYGPLFYLYFKTKQEPSQRLKIRHWLHLLPMFILTIFYLIVFSIFIYSANRGLLKLYSLIAAVSIVISQLSYYGYILTQLYRLPKEKLTHLTWLKPNMWIAIVPCVLVIVSIVFHLNPIYVRYLGYTGIFILVINILRNGISIPEQEQEVEVENPNNSKYEKSGIDQDLSKAYMLALVDLMENEKLFLDSELNLANLANRLNIPPHHLTQAINTQLGKNFYQFINEYRIEYAKSRIKALPSENLLQIAFSSGFKSKTTFNKYFKQQFGQAPSDFRKHIQLQD
ncbi:MAG: helix-turn-helix domain-containing protein [Bacteroidota bacterium]